MRKIYEKNGVQREIKTGFSWVTFLFGFIALLIREQNNMSLVNFVIGSIAGLFTMGIGWYVVSLIQAFDANRRREEQLKLDGWKCITENKGE